MTIVAQSRSYVIGVDCHARTHTYAIIDPRTGEQLGCEQFLTTPSGLNRAISWAARRTGGDATTLWAIEGASLPTAPSSLAPSPIPDSMSEA
ncbi:hypothetical protein JM654_23470 [Microbacterium oxydans]|nr:hypothetical protein [Microbacterium oxydans]